MTLQTFFVKLKGGTGSGNFGHRGRPGKRGGSSSGFSVSNDLKSAIFAYTNLVDYTSKDLVGKLGSEELEDLSRHTQKELKKQGYEKLNVSHKTQNLYEYIEKGDEFSMGDIQSWSLGQGPREYKNYQYEVITSLPFNKVLASSKVSPDLFPIKSEGEIIAKKSTFKVRSVMKDTDDKGNIIFPIRVYADVIE